MRSVYVFNIGDEEWDEEHIVQDSDYHGDRGVDEVNDTDDIEDAVKSYFGVYATEIVRNGDKWDVVLDYAKIKDLTIRRLNETRNLVDETFASLENGESCGLWKFKFSMSDYVNGQVLDADGWLKDLDELLMETAIDNGAMSLTVSQVFEYHV